MNIPNPLWLMSLESSLINIYTNVDVYNFINFKESRFKNTHTHRLLIEIGKI